MGQRRYLPQSAGQASLGSAVQLIRSDTEHTGRPAQQIACDTAFVAFNQIEVGGRDANLLGQFRLSQAQLTPVGPNSRAGYGFLQRRTSFDFRDLSFEQTMFYKNLLITVQFLHIISSKINFLL